MEKLMQLLKTLCEAQGTSGDEDAAAAQTAAAQLSFCDTVELDPLGGVHAFWGNPDAPRQILLDAHIDSIGLAVTGVDENGFLKVCNVGGVDRRVLPGARVTCYGKTKMHGIVCNAPDDGDKVPDIADMGVDVGLTAEEANAQFSAGDRIVIDAPLRRLLGTRVTGAALDDRAGIAALIVAAGEIAAAKPDLGLHVVFSAKEETGGQGAEVQAYRCRPTEAIAVDVTFSTQHGVSGKDAVDMGKGPAIGYAPLLDRKMMKDLIAAADRAGIAYQTEIMGRSTGTNADCIAVSRRGVRTALVSIPQKSMHTPVEICDLKDIEDTGRLIAHYVLGSGGGTEDGR